MAKKINPDQIDMFYKPVYPTRDAELQIDQDRFHSEVSRAVGRALDACKFDRHEISTRMAKALKQDDFSKSMLDAYASESKDTHNISIVRFIALILATDQVWLMDFLANKVGGLVLVGDEPMLAEKAHIDQQMANLAAKKKALTAKPIKIQRRQGR